MTTVNLRNDYKHSPEQLLGLAAELERVEKTKRDYIVPASKMVMIPPMGPAGFDGSASPRLVVESGISPFPVPFGVRKIAHEQIAEKLGIPLAYYRRLEADKPELLCKNVNAWMASNGKNHLLRTLDGNVRALLSDSFRILDNYDAFYQVLPEIQRAGGTILRADVTDEKLYIRAIHPEFQARIQAQGDAFDDNRRTNAAMGHHFRGDNGGSSRPDLVVPGILVRNSEVGRGGLTVAPYIFRLTCSNGLYQDNDLFQVHVGRRQAEGAYISDETREHEDAFLWGKVKDLVRATFDEAKFHEMVATLNGAASQELENPVGAVDNVVKAYGLTDADRQAILNELISPSTDVDPGRTVWGLVNAVTMQAHKAEAESGIEAGMELQRIGGDLLGAKGRELIQVRVR